MGKKRKNPYRKHNVKGKTITEHRLVWEQHRGPIPEGMHTHHVNGDKRDNRIENLQMVDPLTHSRLHTGCRLNEGVWEKWCKDCETYIEVNPTNWNVNSKGSALRSRCKVCAKEFDRLYREDNKEMAAKWREDNKDYMKQYRQDYFEANKDEIRRKDRERYQANKDEVKKREKARYDANKDEINQRRRELRNANREETNRKQRELYHARKEKLNERNRSKESVGGSDSVS